jgi:hypothetical protein
LSESDLGRSVDSFVSESSRSRDDTCRHSYKVSVTDLVRQRDKGKRVGVPTEPGVKMFPGMIPILHPPPPGAGAMIPGQLGPTRRDLV